MFERNQTEPGNRNVIRMMSELAVEVKLDGQNKISIPKNLLTDAGITKEVKIIGVYDHIEFLNPDRYNNLMNVSESSYEDVAKYIFYKDN
jgi:division/cell wall cluster transcriptional repressor MraZ